MRVCENWELYLELESLVMNDSPDKKRIKELRDMFAKRVVECNEHSKLIRREQAVAKADCYYITIEPDGTERTFELQNDVIRHYGMGNRVITRAIANDRPVMAGKNKGLVIKKIMKVEEVGQ